MFLEPINALWVLSSGWGVLSIVVSLIISSGVFLAASLSKVA